MTFRDGLGCFLAKVLFIEIIFVQGRQNYGTRRIKDKLKQRYGLLVSSDLPNTYSFKGWI